MARKNSNTDALTGLFNDSRRPIYAIDAMRRIVYCNRTLAQWLDVDPNRIVGRLVEYHSEPTIDEDEPRDHSPLTDLCPPPQALAGQPCVGTLSCMARGGRLVHRKAEFIPLASADGARSVRKKELAAPAPAVLAMLAEIDLSPEELAKGLSRDPTADELHRTIRRFRRAQAGRYSIESLLGGSVAMQKVRAQLAAAAASGANTLICGTSGSGRGHAARAIHYSAGSDVSARLLPIECELLTDDLLRRLLDRLRESSGEKNQRPTLLLENVERMPGVHQILLSSAIQEKLVGARIIATCTKQGLAGARKTPPHSPKHETGSDAEDAITKIEPALLAAISTITIEIPSLTSRMEDLPVIAQYFLETCNQGSSKQIGSFRSEALDLLALYSWPGELDQLREAIVETHRVATSHEIAAADLPPIVHHASAAAKRIRREPERIVLDELLAAIESEAIVRALSQTGGNKSDAAQLLGMTRPRLYRRLVQLGLVSDDSDESQQELPEFIEREPTE